MARNGFDVCSFVGDTWKAATKQVDRSMRELGENLGADQQRVIDKFENEGLLQGVVELADMTSVGNVATETASAFNLIPDDPALKELISGGLNAATCNPVGQFLAIKDGFDALAAFTNPNAAAVAAMPSAPQTPMSPADAKHQAIEAAKDRAGDRVRDKVRRTEENVLIERLLDRLGDRDGYHCGCDCVSGGIQRDLGELLRLVRDLCGKDKTDRAGDEIDRLVGEGNLCFEDLMFLLMRKVINEGQAEAKGLAEELDTVGASNRQAREQWNGDIEALRNQALSATDPAQRERLSNQLQAMGDKRALDVDERAESRAELAEKLKYTMQKLGEMEQALSNVLNTQHETAMGAIKNIR